MKTLSSALTTALGGVLQQPAWLAYIGWSTPARLSSFSTVSYGGNSFVAADVDVSKVRVEGLRVAGALRLGNADDMFASLALNEGVAGKTVRIYGYDAQAAAADEDFVLLVDCVGGRATIDESQVSIELRPQTAYAYSPRSYVSAPAFTNVVPAGTSLTINGQTYKIER